MVIKNSMHIDEECLAYILSKFSFSRSSTNSNIVLLSAATKLRKLALSEFYSSFSDFNDSLLLM